MRCLFVMFVTTVCFLLFLVIHVMVLNWYLSKQGTRRNVPRDHNAGTSYSLKLIEVTCVFEVDRCKGTGFGFNHKNKLG